MATPSTEIETKGSKSRGEILDAVTRLIAERGFNAITLQDILDSAGATKGKFFHYFKSKDDLYTQLLRHALSSRERLRFTELMSKCEKESSFEKLIFLLDGAIQWHKKGLPEVMRLCVFATVFFPPDSKELKEIERMLGENSKTVESLIRSAQKEGDLPDSLSPRITALLLPSAAIGGNTVGYLSGETSLTSKNIEELKEILHLLHKQTRRRHSA